MNEARQFVVRGTVQGVGFRPFIARLAAAHALAGWVLNAPHGVEIHVEGPGSAIDAFARHVRSHAPPAAVVETVEDRPAAILGLKGFLIRASERHGAPTARIAPDLPQCAACLEEMRDPEARRFEYPYISCSDCGPRFSIIEELPYDRARTTMAPWPLCAACAAEYLDAGDRRFHAEPLACPQCGPSYGLSKGTEVVRGREAIAGAAHLLRDGALVAIKGVGGYHLCCDATNDTAVRELRDRKFRKAKPFAVMAKDISVARSLVELTVDAERLLLCLARPIVLARARLSLAEVAPGHRELGVMLPYAPVHHLLFAAGAPSVLVMTSANRSNEPIAYVDADALTRLHGIADAFLIGERPIARRVEDSVVRGAPSGPVVLRRGRGYAPGVVARFVAAQPILAVGADLKNSITLVVEGEALASHHIGDLEHVAARDAFREAIRDLTAMYALRWDDVIVAHDAHPQYASTIHALDLPASRHVAVQHHRAHVASVMAERGALDRTVVGVAFDGTGHGDDGTIWGGEIFVGSVAGGLSRVAWLRPCAQPGGDAAARHPMQAAAGVLAGIDDLPDLTLPPFAFTPRYERAAQLVEAGVRTFVSTSAGRLFDTAAAILGFRSENEYEGQAAVWLEELAWRSASCDALPFQITDVHMDFRATLHEMIQRRLRGHDCAGLARAFHETLASAISAMACRMCETHTIDTVAVSGGTFQNALLVDRLRWRLPQSIALWTNTQVPPNDGGISLGQAACAAVQQFG
jgi:hydrogenase maturation protein HypF